MHERSQKIAIAEPKPLEPRLEPLLEHFQGIACPAPRISVLLRRQEIHGHRRDERARQDVRGEHGEDDRFRNGMNR